MTDLVSIGEAARQLGVSISTLRRWESEGKIRPEDRTAGGQRRYSLAKISPKVGRRIPSTRETIAYARVSSHDQKDDLERQKKVLENFCSVRGWSFRVVADLGSGMNYNKKGLRQLLSMLMDGQIERLVITHKDRLLRFGAELVFALCEKQNVEVVIINQSENSTFEEELAQDVLEIITVFSARLYGARSRKAAKIIDAVKEISTVSTGKASLNGDI